MAEFFRGGRAGEQEPRWRRLRGRIDANIVVLAAAPIFSLQARRRAGRV
jgi:hypothetical protein